MVLLFPSFALGETVKFEDLIVREGLLYKKFSVVPFSGKTTGNTQGTFRHGKTHGPWVKFWSNGQLHSKGTYKDGIKIGPWVFYYENGQLTFKGNYKNGLDGPWVGYNKDGTVDNELTGTFKNGKKVK